jgi:ribosomal protein S21
LVVERRDNEHAEKLLDRFRLVVQRAGILREAKRRRHFVSKTEARRMARAKAARKIRKTAAKALIKNGGRGGSSRPAPRRG